MQPYIDTAEFDRAPWIAGVIIMAVVAVGSFVASLASVVAAQRHTADVDAGIATLGSQSPRRHVASDDGSGESVEEDDEEDDDDDDDENREL